MGGKTGTTTSSVSIPKDVLDRYNAVNAYASDVAQTPFQPYQGQFVAGLTPTQQAGIQGTSQYAQAAQPYYQAATQQLLGAQESALPGISAAYQNVGGAQDIGQQYAQGATQGIGAALQYAQPYQAGATQAAMAGAQGIQPGQLQTAQYMNPYTQAVANTTYQALQQQQQEQMAGQLGNAIRSGAFGGDRAALAAANLGRQQQLGMAQAMAPIYQQGYGQALQTAQQQQGVQLSADQANRAALQNLAQQLQGIGQAGYGQQMGAAQQLAGLGQQQYGQGMGAAQQLAGLAQQGYGMGAATSQGLANLGTGAQQAGLQGAQAQMGAGTLEQQTQQADLTARYQQFLQERGYPFQVAQFLANIAMGTGALSGSTTQTTQPMPFFSDRRVKHDVKEIGETHDGQPIYSFKYNGDDRTQIGLMAQDVEKSHPEAVHDMGGIKGVDYKEATKDAERTERYEGGLVPASQGGAVTEPGAYGRGGYAPGGLVDPNDIQALLSQQQTAFGPFGESGVYGGTQHQSPFSSTKGVIPSTRLHTPKLMTSGATPRLPESTASEAMRAWDSAKDASNRIQEARSMISRFTKGTPQQEEDKSRTGQTGTDRTKLVGPDIVSDKAKEDPSIWQKIGEYVGVMADGGVVPRSKYAIGGMSKDPSLPYEEDDKSPSKYFPTEILDTDKPELAKANAPTGGTSQTGVGLGDVAKLAMMFLKDGGAVPRHAYADGGDADLDKYLSAIAQIESSGNYGALGPQTKSGDRAYGKYQVMGANIPSWTEEATGKKMTPDEFLADKQAQDVTARHHFGKAYNQYGNPEDAASVWFSGRPVSKAGNATDILGTSVPAYIQKFRSALGQPADLPSEQAVPASGGVVPASSDQAVPESKGAGVMPTAQKWLAENQGWLSPLGAGLKGMVQSKSPFLGGALLEGAGAGLEAIGPAQQQMAQTALTQATKGLTEAETTGKSFHFVPGIGGFMWVVDRQGGGTKLIPYSVYNEDMDRYQQAFGPTPTATQAQSAAREFNIPSVGAPSTTTTAPQAGQAPTTPPKVETVAPSPNFNEKSAAAAKESVKEIQKAQASMMPGVATSPIDEGNAYRKGVVGLAQATRSNFGNTVDYIKNIADATEIGGWQTPGTKSQLRGDVAKVFGTLASAFGSDPSINLGDINDINNKMKALRSQMMAQSAGQESLGALELLSNAMVSGDMSKDTMSKLGAITLMLEGRALDRLDHADKWGQVTGGTYFKAGKNFEEVNSTANFEKELSAVTKMIRDYPDLTKELFSADATEIDKAFMENFGLPNMSRYFRAR